jgi:photosystem II stability/assembly factor-like uncharacterized protein
MKKIFLILLVFHFSLLIANAQWIQQNSGVNAQLYKVKFLNRYTGWTCGAGVILKTTDGGYNWINIPNPASNKSFYGLFILDSNTIYVTGYFETILKTTNSGQNWIEIKNGPWGQGNSYRSVYFINQNTGWIGSTGQKILKTTNSGQSFNEYTTVYDIYDLYFKDSLNGILINFGLGPYKTTNGGINWYYASINLGTIYPWFYNVSVINNQYCYLPGSDGRIFKSTDFGETWDTVARTPVELHTCSIGFANFLTGWVGGNYFQILFKTTNGGMNWVQENVTPFGWFSIYCYNELIVWGVSSPYIIMHTTTGGQPFSQITNSNEQITKEYVLFQNYPNPFNIRTTIKLTINKKSIYRLEVFDILGKKVSELFNKKLKEGNYEIKYNADNLTSGIYIYKLSSEKTSYAKKFLLIK